MSNVAVKTLLCSDGVVGLNGYQFLKDEDDEIMPFKNKKSAISFLLKNGYTIDWIEEWIEFETIRKGETDD